MKKLTPILVVLAVLVLVLFVLNRPSLSVIGADSNKAQVAAVDNPNHSSEIVWLSDVLEPADSIATLTTTVVQADRGCFDRPASRDGERMYALQPRGITIDDSTSNTTSPNLEGSNHIELYPVGEAQATKSGSLGEVATE